jgi:drug/metabolite transporter (DMT)-like permease
MSTFSLWNVLGELVLHDGDPVILAFYREVFTAAVLLTVVALDQRRRGVMPPLPTLREASLFVACGAGGVYGLQLFYILGLSQTSANEGAMFQPLTPVLVLVLAAALGLERLHLWPAAGCTAHVRVSWQKLCGVVTAVGGCAVVVLASSSTHEAASGDEQPDALIGAIYLFISDLGAATFILSQKPLLRTYEPAVVVAGAYGVGAVCMALTAAAWKGAEPATWHVSQTEACVLVFLVLVCGALDYALLTWANKHLDATIVAMYGILQPLATALIAFALLGESLSPLSALGGGAVVAGMVATCTAESCHTMRPIGTLEAERLTDHLLQVEGTSRDNHPRPV